MNIKKIKGIRNKLTCKFKEQLSVLMDNDLIYMMGMPGKLQIKPGRTREELCEIMDSI